MMLELLNSLGLLLDIFGAILIWRYGLPTDVDPQGRNFITTNDRDSNEIAKGKRYRRWQHLGVGFLVSGFGLQLLGNWLG